MTYEAQGSVGGRISRGPEGTQRPQEATSDVGQIWVMPGNAEQDLEISKFDRKWR